MNLNMLQIFQSVGLVVGYVFLQLFVVAAEYDPSVEDSDVIPILSIPNIDNTVLSSPPLDSLSSPTASQSGIVNSAPAPIFQLIDTNIDLPADNSAKVISSSDSSTIYTPLKSNAYSTPANTISASGNSVLLSPYSDSPSAISSTSIRLDSPSEIPVPPTTNADSSTGSCASASGYSSSFGYSASLTGNFPAKLSFSNFQPLKQEFPNSFSSAALSSPSIQNFLNYDISGSTAEKLFNKIGLNIVTGHPNAADIARRASQDAHSFEVLTIPKYFQAVGNSLTKFLEYEGIDVKPNHFESYSTHLENALKYADVNDFESVYQAFANGYVNFIESIGFSVFDKADVLAQIFNKELMALRYS